MPMLRRAKVVKKSWQLWENLFLHEILLHFNQENNFVKTNFSQFEDWEILEVYQVKMTYKMDFNLSFFLCLPLFDLLNFFLKNRPHKGCHKSCLDFGFKISSNPLVFYLITLNSLTQPNSNATIELKINKMWAWLDPPLLNSKYGCPKAKFNKKFEETN